MPRIAEYTAPTENLTESTRGSQAWEQAGRRIGPIFNEAAQFQKEQGAIEAQRIKNLTWPYDILKLQEAQAATAANKGGSARISVHDPRSPRTYGGGPYDG